MRAFLRPLALVFLIFLARVEVRAQSAASSGPPPAGQSSSSTPAAGQHAKKVWTNENIGTVAGHGATVGSGSSLSDRHNLRSYSSDGVSIVRPSAGTVVSPGEALQIEVSLDSGKDISEMVILSPMGGSTEPRTAPPWSFTLDVPRDDVGGSGSLVGAQPIYAVFRRCGSDPNPQAACNQGSRDFPSTELDVEDPSPATKLWSRLPLLSFVSVDDSDYLNIVAFFADGLQLEVTRSTRISFSSTNPAVAVVDENGHVTRTGAGKAEIEVTYIGGGATTRLSIPVDSWILRNADQSDQDQNSNSTR